MRVKAINLQQALLGVALVGAVCLNLADAAEIKGLRVETGATGTRAELQLDREGQYQLIDLHNPDRLVVDFPQSSLRRGFSLPPPAGVVKAVRSGQPQPGTVRIVFDLASNVSPLKPRIEQSADGPRLVLEWPGDGVVELVSAAPKSQPAPTASVTSTPDPIAEIARKAALTPVPVSANASAKDAAATAPAVVGNAMPMATPLPGVVATGIPTRIATGQPAPVVVTPAITESVPAPVIRHAMQPGMRPLVVGSATQTQLPIVFTQARLDKLIRQPLAK